MKKVKLTATGRGTLLALIALSTLSACVVRPVEYREGYWDREHSRYWHDHGWVACDHDDMHCR